MTLACRDGEIEGCPVFLLICLMFGFQALCESAGACQKTQLNLLRLSDQEPS